MKQYIENLNDEIIVIEAKRSVICELQEVIARIERDIEWDKSRLINENGTENDYYKNDLEEQTKRLRIYKSLFKDIAECISNI